MKKFKKLAAVLAALVLALSCFVACSNGDDGSSTSTSSSNSTSSTALQGLWIIDENEPESYGYYFIGNTRYSVISISGKYYCIEDSKVNFSVSGDKIVVEIEGQTYEASFTINGNTATISTAGTSKIWKKVDTIPIKITESEFENLFL
ncbi:MAG: hypothetical protein K2N58_07070 [Treponemataceae bacterium]|nr:hypothetical protein [Treponemataceae bacterium]